MNIAFLSMFICGVNFLSNALPISMIHDQSLIQAPHLLQKLKKNPSQFIDEMSKVDPAEVTKIINLLKDELQKSEDKETELIQKVAIAEAALGAASNDAITAEGTLEDAKEDQTSAERALSDFKVVREQKLAAKNAAQETHDDEINALNDEQNVLTTVIQLLRDLIASKVKYWAVGPIASTDVSDDSCGPDGVLAMPKTHAEQQNVLDILPSLPSGGAYSGTYAWLGGKFDESSSSWKWNDGSPVGLPGTGETNWDNGEGLPERGPGESYLGLKRESGLWHDFHGNGPEVDPGQMALCQGFQDVDNTGSYSDLRLVFTKNHGSSAICVDDLRLFLNKEEISFPDQTTVQETGAWSGSYLGKNLLSGVGGYYCSESGSCNQNECNYETLTITMPEAIKFDEYSLRQADGMGYNPSEFILEGKPTESSEWQVISSVTDFNFPYGGATETWPLDVSTQAPTQGQGFVQIGRNLLSSNALSVLEMFKKNSTSFISEMLVASPEAIEEIIALLTDLKKTSEARENLLVDELNQAIHELGEASNDVVGAQGALDAAIAAVDAAAQDLAIKKLTQMEKQAIKDSAQGILDDELPGLDEEQSVFTTVIERLEELK